MNKKINKKTNRKIKKIFVWCSPENILSGKFSPTGQAGVTSLLLKSDIANFKIFTPTIYNFIFLVFYFYISLLFNKKALIYIVASRTLLGFFRDIPALSSFIFKKKIYCHIHGTDLYRLFQNKNFGFIAKIFYSKVHKVIAPTKYALTNHKNLEFLKSKKKVISNPTFSNLNFINHNKQNIKNISPVILWNSNLISSKGIFNTLDALVLISKKKKIKFKFLVLGKEYTDNELTKSQVKMKFASYISFSWLNHIGPTSFVEAQNILHKSDIVILPSRYRSESQPLALIFAMILGKIIVTSNHPSILETLGNYPAYIVNDTQSPEEISNKILLAINQKNSCKIIDDRFINSAKEKYSLERFFESMKNIFDDQ